jgi:murein DD-endopeptidase MepM/ murein hydrolase activator NlpD
VDSSTPWIFNESSKSSSSSFPSHDDGGDDELEKDTVVSVELLSSGIIQASNNHNFNSVAYVSVLNSSLVDKFSKPLRNGMTMLELNEGERLNVPCATFVLILKPWERISFCKSTSKIDHDYIDTLSFQLKSHPDPKGMSQLKIPKLEGFPLRRNGKKFVCTQGFGGRLTHFFPESYHAVDFRCSEGTEVLAVSDGIITDVTEDCEIKGIHCENLGHWNSISLKMDNGFTADYVHIMPKSSRVKVGQRVCVGETLCLSGTIGFCPEPHLHFEIHRNDHLRGPSVLFEFETFNKEIVRMPVAGVEY